MPSRRKTLHFKSAAAAQRYIDTNGGDAVVSAEFTVQPGTKQEKTEAQKQREQEERKKLEYKFESIFRWYCPEVQLTPQYRFFVDRQWKMDFAIPSLKIAFEIDGGTWKDERSGHSWGKGVTNDCEKRNTAAIMGWTVFRFTADMLERKNLPTYVEPVADYVLRQLSFYSEKIDS